MTIQASESLKGDDAFEVGYQSTQCPPIIQTKKVTPLDFIEIKEANGDSGTSTSCQVEAAYSKKVLFSAPASHNKASNGNVDKVDQLRKANWHQLSVLDLLGDDGPDSNFGGSLEHEAHVAFSVEGLGKVETETPVHSPEQLGRSFSYDCSRPAKATRRTYSSKNLNSGLNDLESEVVRA
ncbi:unnamed protein product [Ilex paraguariensis]|uniref:Uncharacterized protein n=1 Tax=Ilex paraguariensis TaxID=185542 RepID=A0ABC8RCS6_9AQUA